MKPSFAVAQYALVCVFIRDISGMGPNHFEKKNMSDRVILTTFLAWPIILKLFESGVHLAVRWILRFLGPIIFSKWPIKLSKGPSKS